MLNKFDALSSVSGYCDRDIARELDTTIANVKAWRSGRRVAPAFAIHSMAELVGEIQDAAELLIDRFFDIAADEEIEELHIGVAENDEEANHSGFRSAAFHKAVAAQMLSRGLGMGWKVELVAFDQTRLFSTRYEEEERAASALFNGFTEFLAQEVKKMAAERDARA